MEIPNFHKVADDPSKAKEVAESMRSSLSSLNEDYPFLQASNIIPSTIPENPLMKFQLYVNGATLRLYIYDSVNATWRYAVLI